MRSLVAIALLLAGGAAHAAPPVIDDCRGHVVPPAVVRVELTAAGRLILQKRPTRDVTEDPQSVAEEAARVAEARRAQHPDESAAVLLRADGQAPADQMLAFAAALSPLLGDRAGILMLATAGERTCALPLVIDPEGDEIDSFTTWGVVLDIAANTRPPLRVAPPRD